MTDREFVDAVEMHRVPNDSFHHEDHLRLAWAYLGEYPAVEDAIVRIRQTLQRFAAAAGCPDKYHESMTVFWMRYLAAIKTKGTLVDTFDRVLASYGHVLGKDVPFAYYSRDVLLSDAARGSWVPPDRQTIDADAIETDTGHPSSHASNRLVSRRASQR
jgi:hypothetical protein